MKCTCPCSMVCCDCRHRSGDAKQAATQCLTCYLLPRQVWLTPVQGLCTVTHGLLAVYECQTLHAVINIACWQIFPRYKDFLAHLLLVQQHDLTAPLSCCNLQDTSTAQLWAKSTGLRVAGRFCDITLVSSHTTLGSYTHLSSCSMQCKQSRGVVT